MKKKSVVLFASILLFTACASSDVKPKSKLVVKHEVNQKGEPLWLEDPYIENDKVAAVGCARRHFKGKVAQRKKAESIALDEIATQVKTTVSNQTLRDQKHYNGREVYSKVHTISGQKVDDVSVSTKIKDSYTSEDGNICVWMVLR